MITWQQTSPMTPDMTHTVIQTHTTVQVIIILFPVITINIYILLLLFSPKLNIYKQIQNYLERIKYSQFIIIYEGLFNLSWYMKRVLYSYENYINSDTLPFL